MDNVIFRYGHVSVSHNIFKTAKRTYKIQYIERLQIKRPWFLFSLPLSVISGVLLMNYPEYLYLYERYACAFFLFILPALLFQIGVLSVTSKSYVNDNAVTGFIPHLKKTRAALESVLIETQ